MADSFSPAYDSTRDFFAAALSFSRALLFPFPAKAGIQIGSAEYGDAPKIPPPRQNKRFLYPADFQYNGEPPPTKKTTRFDVNSDQKPNCRRYRKSGGGY